VRIGTAVESRDMTGIAVKIQYYEILRSVDRRN
jgi:hypothetical protein